MESADETNRTVSSKLDHDAGEGLLSAGEEGEAIDAAPTAIDVIVGEIPAAEDPTSLWWTARCTDPHHDLLGSFQTRGEAEQMRADHLRSAHMGAS